LCFFKLKYTITLNFKEVHNFVNISKRLNFTHIKEYVRN
jgi:hypothetical protein